MNKIAKILGACGMVALCACGSNNGAQNGDTVIIDFAGFDENGVQFEGGTASNFALKLGSGQFVPGFEDQLVGAKVDESRDVKVTFPTDYVPELAGKDVVFKVTVHEIIHE